MNEGTVKVISDAIDMIAKKLGVAVDMVYPVLLKQAKVDFITELVDVLFGVIFIVIAISLGRKFYKMLKSDKCPTDEDEIVAIFCVIGGIFFIIMGILFVTTSVSDAVQTYVNPEYYIFKEYVQPLIK